MSKENNQSKSYGAFSIVVLTISIVVGSGIFFKNDEVYNATNSAITTIIAWFLVSGLVVSILYAFIEISSSTAKTGEIGSLSSWANKFFGTKTARVVGYFFVFINLPINTALLSIYASNLFFDLVLIPSNDFQFWIRTIGTTLFAIAILASMGLMNSYSNKQSKAIQKVSFTFKILPILFLIILYFGVLISSIFNGGFSQGIDGYSSFWDQSKNTGIEGKSIGTVISLIVISIPPVMFAFDGFIYSANLQAETKSKKSFSAGLIMGIGLIIVMYILVSISMFSLGNGSYSLFGVIENVFPDQAWLAYLFNVILILSIITGISGLYSASMRATSSLSTDNLVKDEKMSLIKKNKNSVATRSGYAFGLICLVWMIYLRFFDTISSVDQWYWNPILNDQGIKEVGSYMAISGGAANSAVILAFIFYAFIIFGGMLNRRKNKVDVDRLPAFMLISIIAIAGVLFVSIFSIVNLFFKDFNSVSDYLSILIAITYPLVIAIVYFYNKRKLDFLTDDFVVKKQSFIDKYYE